MKLSKILLPLACLLVLTVTAPVAFADGDRPKTIAGWVEPVRFPEKGLVVKAKLDTGAKTSSIFAVNTEEFRKGKQDWVRFDLYLEDIRDEAHRITMERPILRKVKIKNHDGKHDHRVVIDLQICFAGSIYQTEFSLADRNEYIYNVLLGRKFLEGVAIVDAETRYQTIAKCEDLPVEEDLPAENSDKLAADETASTIAGVDTFLPTELETSAETGQNNEKMITN
jgi:hypothetical protein